MYENIVNELTEGRILIQKEIEVDYTGLKSVNRS
jgi:hypothetical protein